MYASPDLTYTPSLAVCANCMTQSISSAACFPNVCVVLIASSRFGFGGHSAKLTHRRE